MAPFIVMEGVANRSLTQMLFFIAPPTPPQTPELRLPQKPPPESPHACGRDQKINDSAEAGEIDDVINVAAAKTTISNFFSRFETFGFRVNMLTC